MAKNVRSEERVNNALQQMKGAKAFSVDCYDAGPSLVKVTKTGIVTTVHIEDKTQVGSVTRAGSMVYVAKGENPEGIASALFQSELMHATKGVAYAAG